MSNQSVPRYMRDVQKLAEEYGYIVTRTRSDHLKLVREGWPTIFHSGTPSDRRANLNLRAHLRRVKRQQEEIT